MAGHELLSDQGLRLDGRKPGELRKIQCSLGMFSEASGSAYIEQGNMKVYAAVYGPHKARSNQKVEENRAVVNCQFSMATFSTAQRKERPRGDRKSDEISLHLKETFESAIKLELYPRSQIDIYLQVIQSDGGVYSSCVNVGTLALIEAGIEMIDYVCSCSVAFIKDVPLADVNYVEESSGRPVVTVATLPRTKKILLTQMTARLHIDNMGKMLDVAVNSCNDIHNILKRSVEEHLLQRGPLVDWNT